MTSKSENILLCIKLIWVICDIENINQPILCFSSYYCISLIKIKLLKTEQNIFKLQVSREDINFERMSWK